MKAKTAFGLGCVCGQLAKMRQMIDVEALDRETMENMVMAETLRVMEEIERLVTEEEEDAEEG